MRRVLSIGLTVLVVVIVVFGISRWWSGQTTAATTASIASAAEPTATPMATALSVAPGVCPKTPEEASSLFGGAASRWETTADPGGWHLREEPFRTSIDQKGFVLEGYYDTAPGKNPRQFVSKNAIEVQGCTIWCGATAQELFCAMGWQKFQRHGISYDAWKGGIEAVGFDKPASCPLGQAQTASASTATPVPTAIAPTSVPTNPTPATSNGTNWSALLGVPATRLENCPGEPAATCTHVKDGQIISVSVPTGYKYEGWDGGKVINGVGPATIKAAGLTVRNNT